jgi:hypothetical protein
MSVLPRYPASRSRKERPPKGWVLPMAGLRMRMGNCRLSNPVVDESSTQLCILVALKVGALLLSQVGSLRFVKCFAGMKYIYPLSSLLQGWPHCLAWVGSYVLYIGRRRLPLLGLRTMDLFPETGSYWEYLTNVRRAIPPGPNKVFSRARHSLPRSRTQNSRDSCYLKQSL